MTNYLKEIISYRSFSMMDEAYLVNHIKVLDFAETALDSLLPQETVCETSLDFKSDLVKCKVTAKKNPFKWAYELASDMHP